MSKSNDETFQFVSHCSRNPLKTEKKVRILNFSAGIQIQKQNHFTHLPHTQPAVRMSHINLLKPTGYVMHNQFIIQQLYVLPTHRIYVFCIYLRTNSDLCHLQHKLIGFYNRDLTLYSPVVTICTTSLTFNNSTFCPHSVFMWFMWI